MKAVKKVFSLLVSALGVLVLSGFLSLQPIGGLQAGPSGPAGAAGSDPAFAHHEPAHACNDVTGVTAGVPSPKGSGRNAGVEDSGHLDFNADPPAQSYQTCAERGQVGREDVWFLKGWSWNTNLGYISFYCDGGQNFGGVCSNQANPVDYETYLDSSGQVKGWAWGDNIGWISMTCNEGKNVAERDCGKDVGANYSGVRVVQDPIADKPESDRMDCTAAELGRPLQRGDFYGYAWSDSVGWLNFCGAHVELESPLVPEVTIETSNPTEEPGPGPGGCAENDGLCGSIDGGDLGGAGAVTEGLVYANGSDFYKIVVKVKDGETTLDQAGLTAHDVSAVLTFDNKLRADQVTLCDPEDCTYNGAILPPSSLTPEANWDETEQGLVAYVQAIAPTNYAGDNNPLNDTDTINLSEFSIVIDGINYPQPTRSFEFRPAVEVTQIVSVDSPPQPPVTDSVFAQREISTEHQIGAAFRPSLPDGPLPNSDAVKSAVQIFTQLHDCSNAFDFLFDEAWSGVGITNEDGTEERDSINYTNGGDLNIDRPGNICSEGAFATTATLRDIDRRSVEGVGDGIEGTLLNEFLASGDLTGTISRFIFSRVQDPAFATNIRTDRAFGIQTRVEYDVTIGTEARSVKYFSRRVRDGSLLNQAADIRGNVRILQDTTGLPAGRGERRTIGERFISARELFVRAISKRAKGQATEIEEKTFNNTAGTNLVDPEYFFKRDTATVDVDEPCRIIFDNPANITFTGNITIQSTGCDVYFFQNIRPSPGSKLGIIALEDLTMTGERKGGSVYICGKVTDLENVHIAADRSVFSLGELDDAGNISCGTPADRVVQSDLRAGLPKFDLGDPVREVLKNQLTIVGSVRSNNCDGCAFKSPPESGDGSKITNSALMDTARFYDWNFMRYSKVDDAGTCWAADVALSALLGVAEPVCDNNNPVNRGSVNVIFQEPTGLPIFKDAAKQR